MAEKILELNHLAKSFGDHKVLKDISISVEKGEIINKVSGARPKHQILKLLEG